VSNFFVDSSALAKRYLTETGSAWVISWIEPSAGNVIIISELALTEVQSLLARHVRHGTLSLAGATALRNDFLIHFRDDYLVVSVETPIFQAGGHLVNKHKLRTLDATQLASAIHALSILVEPMTFVSADLNLLAAATAEGFPIDDPHTHP
jgi:uncharacterized protein